MFRPRHKDGAFLLSKRLKDLLKGYKIEVAMENLQTQRVVSANSVFDTWFIEAKSLYMYYFNVLPSLNSISQVNGEKALGLFKEKFKDLVECIHQYQWYKIKKKKYQFDKTIVVLKNNCLVEFGEAYVEVLHNGESQTFLEEATTLINQCRTRGKREPLEINLVTGSGSSMELKTMEVKRVKLDLDLFYEDDFKEVDALIRTRLNTEKDKGIVLLYGSSGAGKTTYLRYLIGKVKKRVMFLSPSIAGNLMEPGFIDLLIDNPNTIVIIEDAENILIDRKLQNSSSVSNLLNISDGLLADFLNVQIICTFNSSLSLIDSALIRKGRLIAKYEFGKLSVAKAQRLSKHLGFDTKITRPMTIAEVANQHEKDQQGNRVEVIGFRSSLIEN